MPFDPNAPYEKVDDIGKKASSFDPNAPYEKVGFDPNAPFKDIGNINDPDYIMTEAEFRKDQEERQKRGLLDKTVALAKEFPGGIWNAFKPFVSAPSGIAGQASTGDLKGAASTTLEGAAQGTFNTGNLARRIIRGIGDAMVLRKGEDLEDDPKVAEENRIKREYQNYLNDKAYANVSKRAATGEKAALPQFLQKNIDPQTAEEAGQFLDPITIATLGAGALGKATIKKIGEAALEKAVEPTAGGIERVGNVLSKTSDLPLRGANAVLGTVIKDPDTASKIVAGVLGAAETGGMHLPVVGPVSQAVVGTKVAGKSLEKAGEIGKTIAGALAKEETQVPFFKRIAQDESVTPWMRDAAKTMEKIGASPLVEYGKRAAVSGAHGAVVGGALGVASGDSPEELGQAIGGGIGVGTALSPFHWISEEPARRTAKEDASIAQWMQGQAENGSSIDHLKKLDRSTALQAATLSEVLGDGVKSKFVDGETFSQLPVRPGAAAFYAGGEIIINADAKGLNENFLHEYGHALAEATGKMDQIKSVIDSTLGETGVYNFKRDYAQAFIKDKNLTPVEREVQTRAIINDLDRTHGEYWAQQEIFAESFVDTFFGRNINRALTEKGQSKAILEGRPGVESSKLSLMARMLQQMGIPLDERGTGEVVDKPNLISKISDPRLRKMVLDYTKELNDYISTEPGATKELSEPPLTKEQILNDDPRARGSDMVIRDEQGRPIGIRSRAEVEKIQGKESKDGSELTVGTRGKVVLDYLKDWIATGDYAGINIAGKRLPPGLIDEMEKRGVINKFQADNLRLLEQQLVSGKNIQGYYQSVYLRNGNMPVDYKAVTPVSMKITQAGNIIINSVDALAAEKKVLRTFMKTDVVKRNWKTVADYRNDVLRYMDNLNRPDAKPGDSNQMFGEEKAKILNAFFNVNDNAHPNDASALINTSKMKRNPDQLFKSYRLDRWNTITPSDRQSFQVNYKGMRDMWRPELGENVPRETNDVNDLGFYSQAAYLDAVKRGNVDMSSIELAINSAKKIAAMFGRLDDREAVADLSNSIKGIYQSHKMLKENLVLPSFYKMWKKNLKTSTEGFDIILRRFSGNVKRGLVVLDENLNTKNGSTYHYLEYNGNPVNVRIADHEQRADRSGNDDGFLSRSRSTSVKSPIDLNIVVKNLPETKKERQFIIGNVLDHLNLERFYDRDGYGDRLTVKQESQSIGKINPDMPGSERDELISKNTGQSNSALGDNFVNSFKAYDAAGNVIPLSKRFNSEMNDIRYQPASQSPIMWRPELGENASSPKDINDLGFYSQAARTAESFKDKNAKMTGEGWEKWLSNQPGIKKEELDVLSLKDVPDKMTPTEVAEWIKANNVPLQEVVKGDENGGYDVSSSSSGHTEAASSLEHAKEIKKEWVNILLRDVITDSDLSVEENENGKWIVVDRDGYQMEGLEKDDRGRVFHQWSDEYDSKESANKDIEDYLREDISGSISIEKSDSTNTKFDQYQLPGGKNYKEVLLTLPKKMEKIDPMPFWEGYAKSKYGKKYNEITEEQQKEVQKGTERYTQGNQTVEGTTFRSSHFNEPNILVHARLNDRVGADGKKTLFIEEIQSDQHQTGRKEGYEHKKQEGFGLLIKTGPQAGHFVDNPDEGQRFQFVEKDDAQIMADAMNEDESGHIEVAPFTQIVKGVPDAPFKTAWPMLMMKRILQKAAAEGYDRVAWTTGEQQAERYDLRKTISSVAYSGSNLKAFDHEGETVINKTGVLPEELPDIIGKEAAEKLLAAPKIGTLRTIEGEDLKMGGEGMNGFYDNILPKMVNHYAKKQKWDTKVGETEIDIPNKRVSVHSIDITPNVRESITTKGQPMFRPEIIGTAVKDGDGYKQGSSPFSAHDEIQKWAPESIRGFIAIAANGKPVFVNRQDATDIAKLSGQLYEGEDELHSHMLRGESKPERKANPLFE